MAVSRDAIEARYRADLEAAEAWKEVNPERYAEERFKATERKSDGLAELADQATAESRRVSLDSAKAAALSKYPLAASMARFISGNTAEEIEAAAKEIHEGVNAQNEAALRAAQEARRPQTRAAWTGSPNGARPGLPGGELNQPQARDTELVNNTYDRTAEFLREASRPGTQRTYSDKAGEVLRAQDPEAQAIADYQVLHPNTGLSQRAMKAKNDGTAQFEAAPITPEDRKG